MTGRTMLGLKVPTSKGTEASLSCVQCFLYVVSSSVTVSIFHIIRLDTFWTGLIFKQSVFWPIIFLHTLVISESPLSLSPLKYLHLFILFDKLPTIWNM